VAEAGITFTVHEAADRRRPVDFFHQCYTLTYQAHHSTPYLTRDFFQAHGATHAAALGDVRGAAGGQPIAASLVAVDRGAARPGAATGAVSTYVPCLHFEACYYQPLAWCMAQGFVRFEGGAQGEHKMARGLLPVATRSAHWLRDPRLRLRWPTSWPPRAWASASTWTNCASATRSKAPDQAGCAAL
jgi:predicted N-acyltransferase